ncbi:MAG: DedA family protein, partial [Acidobacteria bacterium]
MLEHAITRHGYLLLFGGVMVEGDAFLLGAAFLANRGQLQFPLVLLVATAGTMVADQVYYQLARARGRAMLAAKAAAQPGIERVRRWVERRAVLLLFLSRFMYGFRAAIPMACGAVGMPAARFTAVNLLGSGLWALSFGLAGYAFGSAVDIGLSNVRNGERAVAILLLAIVAVGLALKRREGPQRLSAMRHPVKDALRMGRRLFVASHRHGGMVLTRPHTRLAAFVVGVGLLNVVTAVFHWPFAIMSVLDSWLPIEAAHVSRAALLVAGGALVAVGRGLARRKRVAWAIACLATLASVPLH